MIPVCEKLTTQLYHKFIRTKLKSLPRRYFDHPDLTICLFAKWVNWVFWNLMVFFFLVYKIIAITETICDLKKHKHIGFNSYLSYIYTVVGTPNSNLPKLTAGSGFIA